MIEAYFIGVRSKANKIQGTNTIKAIVIGSKLTQQNVIRWSNRIRGKVALNHTNKKQKIQHFKPKIIDCKLMIELLINNSEQA